VTLRRHSKSLEINHSKGRTLLHRSYRLFYISSEIQRYIGRKSLFFTPHVHSTSPLGNPCRPIDVKSRMMVLPDGDKGWE